MKRSLNVIISFLMVFTFFFVLPQSARAEEDLIIPEWIVDAQLLENGDLQITEDITFEIYYDSNGVFREVVLDKTSGIADISVQELIGSSSKAYTYVDKAKNGDAEVFQLIEEDNKIRIKIYSPAEDELKAFRLSYTIKNVAIKYNDTGELYYKFLGSENETPIESFKVYIRLPGEAQDDQVKVFAHGPLNGKIDKADNSTYTLYVENVPSKTFIEGRVVFPTEFISISNNVQNINNLSNILAEEAAFQGKLQADRERREKLRGVFDQVSLIISVLGAALFAFLLFSLKREKNVYHDKGFDVNGIPEDCTPAVASFLVSAMINTNTVFATILDLMRKGFLTLTKEEVEGKKRRRTDLDDFVLTKLKDEDDSLLPHEKHFLSWIFDHMGDGESVSNIDIENYNKRHSSAFLKKYQEWNKQIKQDAIDKGYYDSSKAGYGVILLVLSVVTFVIAILSLVYGGLYGVLGLIIGSVLFIYSITLFFRRSDLGHQQYLLWKEFKKYIKQYNPEFDIEDLGRSIPDASLIYGLALGVTKKLRDFNLDTVSYQGAYYNNWFFWYLIFHDSNNNSFHKSLNKSFTGSTSTSSSSGSFSSGGGGGAGGGGAGGF